MATATKTKKTKAVQQAEATRLKQAIVRMLAAKDRAKDAYSEADSLLEYVLEHLQPGETLDIGGGQVAHVVDNFAERNKVFKQCGVARYDVKISRR